MDLFLSSKPMLTLCYFWIAPIKKLYQATKISRIAYVRVFFVVAIAVLLVASDNSTLAASEICLIVLYAISAEHIEKNSDSAALSMPGAIGSLMLMILARLSALFLTVSVPVVLISTIATDDSSPLLITIKTYLVFAGSMLSTNRHWGKKKRVKAHSLSFSGAQ